MKIIYRILIKILIKLKTLLTRLGIILVKITGKSSQKIHPKHLIDSSHHHWYKDWISKSDTILDIGSGRGEHALWLSSFSKEIICVDYDKKALKIAQELSKENNILNIYYIVMNLENPLPFKECIFFDKIFLLDVIEHLYNRVSLLKELSRVLKKDGLIFISAPNIDNSWKQRLRRLGLPYYSSSDHKIEYKLVELIEEIKEGGFKVINEPRPTVFETPLSGIIDFLGGINLSLYKKLQYWKIKKAQENPQEATGWRIICQKINT